MAASVVSDTVTAAFKPVFAALMDLLKFEIYSHVNTGDKTQDNLINIFLMSIISVIFTVISWNTIIVRFKMWKNADKYKKITQDNVSYYRDLAAGMKGKFNYASWFVSDDKVGFSNKIAIHYSTIHKNTTPSNPVFYNFNSKKFEHSERSSPFDILKKTLAVEIHEPIYINDDGLVCLYKENTTGTISMAYTSDSALKAFIATFNLTGEDAGLVYGDKNTTYIYSLTGRVLGNIYPDRTFDMFISRHKPDILAALDAFIEANKSGAALGGYGTYNLGMLLHGDPGTGKTFLIKAIALYLKRSVKIINMHSIKSKQDFEVVFDNYENYVYCLEEFDCVQGVIQQRTDDGKATKDFISNELKDLRDRHLELLKIMAMSGGSKDSKSTDSGTPIEQEIKLIKTRITELENALTLDTILTVLDGVKEHRGRVVIATTNYLNKIDDALLRPGRFDLKINLGKFISSEIKEMLEHMFTGAASAEEFEELETTVFPDKKYAPVDVIHIARCSKTLAKTIEVLKKEF